MTKKMLIDATHPEETRVVVVDGNKVEDFDFESASKRQLAGNIYLAKVTRVEPSLQAAFIDYGGNRHGFLAFGEIHPDYYQIPIADRQALLAEERAMARGEDDGGEDEEAAETGRRRDDRRRRGQGHGQGRGQGRALAREGDAVTSREPAGMETIDLDPEDDGPEPPAEVHGFGADPAEGFSPMTTVAETPVETPATDADEDHGAVETVEKDDTIETVGEDDDALDHRPVRKPSRARRYKIQEVIKVRQIMLVQVVKEERGNKGAALTTYLSLAGRYCVLMPNTARGGGISRKITNVADRKKLKEIAAEMDVPEGAGLIIRTAGSQRTKAEIKRDYEYLQRLWEQIRELTLKSIAPAKIYEEGDIIKRSIRDLYSKDIDEVIVEGAEGYRNARDFMKMIMPTHARQVVPHQDDQPLFARHQVEGFLASMFNPTVQLPSGGYIVIGVTEALVAIDVNSGRATREGSIEQTALKTNLEASDEVARQLRLRDLAGLIVVDYIDMEERRNNAAVEKRLKDRLKTDRARIQVGRISGFGLLEMSRQRLRPGMLEATTQPCPHCHGTGLLRSDDNVALAILRQLDEEGVRGRAKEVLLRVPVGIMNYLMNHKREHVAGIEQRTGMAVRIEADLALVSPDFAIERFRTATRAVPEALPIVRASADLMGEEAVEEPEAEVEELDEAEAAETEDVAADGSAAPASEDDRPRRKRRRRRRRRGDRPEAGAEGQDAADDGVEDEPDDEDEATEATAELMEVESAKVVPEEGAVAAAEDEAPRRRTRTRTRRAAEEPAPESKAEAEPEAPAEEAPAPKRSRARRKPAEASEAPVEAVVEAPAEEAAPRRARGSRRAAPIPAAEAEPSAEPIPGPATMPAEEAMPQPEPMLDTTPRPQREPGGDAEPPAERAFEAEPAPPTEPQAEPQAERPKRRGWWSLGR